MAADTSPNSAQDLEIQITEESDNEQRESDNEQEDSEKNECSIKDNEARDDDDRRSLNGNKDDNGRGDSKLRIWTSSNDTKAIRSRIFVGHLNTDRATRSDVEKLFEKCGKINAISMLSGYGFVQFDNEESARKAIDKYHGTVFFNTKLVVDKPAAWKRLDGENPRDPKPWARRSRSDEDDRRGFSRRRRDYHDDHHDDYPSRYRDPSYERYLEMRYMEERLAERYRYPDRLYDRYLPPSRYQPPPPDYAPPSRSDYPAPSRGYEYQRDDDHDRRPFDYNYR